jgi:hypothetical protein
MSASGAAERKSTFSASTFWAVLSGMPRQ